MLNRYLRFAPAYDFLIKLIFSLILTCAVGPLTVNVEMETPITLQTLFLLFSAIAFGWKIGTLNALLYVLLGMAGLPVFSGYHGGAEHVFGPSGGFFFGFIGGTLIAGYLAEIELLQRPWFHILIWFAGHLIILLMGGLWLRRFIPDLWWENILHTLPGAFVKSAFGFLFIQILIRLLAGRENAYISKKSSS